MEPKTFKAQCNELRADCKRIEDACRGLKNTEAVTGPCCLRQMTPEEIEEARRNPKAEPNRPAFPKSRLMSS